MKPSITSRPRNFSFTLLIAAAILVPLLAPAEITHRWSFSETSGTTLADSVGTADGQVVVQGGPGHALGGGQVTLTGGDEATADFVQFPANLLQGLSEFTIELWATPHSFMNWGRVFCFGSGGSSANSLFLSFSRSTSANAQRLDFLPLPNIDTGLSTTANQQYHYVVVWDDDGGALGSGRLEWYRDGVLAGGRDTGTTTVTSVNDTVLWLGRPHPNSNDTANASWNEVRLYDEVLTPEAIAANTTGGPGDATGAAPVAAGDSVELNVGAQALVSVLVNDTGAGISPSSVEVVSLPASGTAVPDANGRILYTHTGGVTGADSFTYRVRNIFGTVSNTVSVNVTISSSVRVENTTMMMPEDPPALGYTGVTAFTGTSWTNPLCLRTPPGETDRLFVLEKGGRIQIITDVTASSPQKVLFLDLAALVNARADETFSSGGEGGLLGLAFHPDYAVNGQFFVFYTLTIDDGGGTFVLHDRLSRFEVSAGDPNAADTTSEQPFITQLDEASNHNGGGMHFGPQDGYLYLSLGDEGGGNDTYQNSQRIDKDFFSSMLRIDVDKKAGNELPNDHPSIETHNGAPVSAGGIPFYLVPADNPWAGPGTFSFNGVTYDPDVPGSAVRTEFWAVGLRNPWRWWFDPQTDEIILADVGQGQREEIDIVEAGKNYEWDFREGNRQREVPPAGFVGTPPIYEYNHGFGAFQGNSVTGGVVYYGTDPLTDYPELDGLYIFADYVSGNVWSLDRSGPVTVERLFGDANISAFGYDPSNGDVLYCDLGDDQVKRLVRVTTESNFPETLSATGAYAELASLTPNPGTLFYEPNVSFWSDYAIKSRWFTVPSVPDKITWSKDGNWGFPSGMVWVKHFDLELERGDPATAKRIETRFLVKNPGGSYGVSYKWNDAGTEAYLVEDAGLDVSYDIDTDPSPGVTLQQQVYNIPSRAACLSCHTPVGGHALSFNTRQLNRTGSIGGILQNQVKTLSDAGYFTSGVAGIHTFPRFARADEAGYSLEYRVRSYLAVNCVQCHQPGGTGGTTWDAHAAITTDATGLINGAANNNGGNPANLLIVPGSEANSILLQRIMASGGFGRMPNIGSNELDDVSIQLVKDWINLDLPSRQSYQEWRVAHFGNDTSSEGEKSADADGDGDDNYREFLTRNDPNDSTERWSHSVTTSGSDISFPYERTSNRGFYLEASWDLVNWVPWDVPGNSPSYSAITTSEIFSASLGLIPGTPYFFRWVILEL